MNIQYNLFQYNLPFSSMIRWISQCALLANSLTQWHMAGNKDTVLNTPCQTEKKPFYHLLWFTCTVGLVQASAHLSVDEEDIKVSKCLRDIWNNPCVTEQILYCYNWRHAFPSLRQFWRLWETRCSNRLNYLCKIILEISLKTEWHLCIA